MESNPFITGDSSDPLLKENMQKFLQKLDEVTFFFLVFHISLYMIYFSLLCSHTILKTM